MKAIKRLTVHFQKENKDLLRIDSIQSFELIYRENWSLLFNIAYKRLKSVEKTEDIIQELFVNIWEKRQQINIQESIQAYLITALKSRVLNHLRNEMIHSKHLDRIQLKTVPFEEPSDKEIEFRELEETIKKQILKLPEKCRAVFLLSRDHQLSIKEISSKLNISANTVEKHIVKALKILRVNLKDFVSLLLLASIL